MTTWKWGDIYYWIGTREQLNLAEIDSKDIRELLQRYDVNVLISNASFSVDHTEG